MKNTYNSQIRQLKKIGFTKIKCSNLDNFKKLIQKYLVKILKKNKNNFRFKYNKNINIDSLRQKITKISDYELNIFKQKLESEISLKIFLEFSRNFKGILGNKFYVSKHGQLQLHQGKNPNTATWPHCEMMSGHSPFTFNLFIPFHNIIDKSGLFIINDKLSIKLFDYEKRKKVLNRNNLISKHKFFPKLNFGEALLFNSFACHGADLHNSPLTRIALIMRFQNYRNPFFEKNLDHFQFINLHEKINISNKFS